MKQPPRRGRLRSGAIRKALVAISVCTVSHIAHPTHPAAHPATASDDDAAPATDAQTATSTPRRARTIAPPMSYSRVSPRVTKIQSLPGIDTEGRLNVTDEDAMGSAAERRAVVGSPTFRCRSLSSR